jgi:hypothetical protein
MLLQLIVGLALVLAELLVELVMEGAELPVPDLPETWHPLLATLGQLITGGSAGGLSLWLLPERILQAGPLPGLSCVLAPLGVGLAMAAWGRYRRAGGHETTSLDTWYGGGALALGVALVRFFGTR